MDAQELRNLQEAYLDVYIQDVSYVDLNESMLDDLMSKSSELEAMRGAASDRALGRIRKMRATLGDTSPAKPSSKPSKPGSSKKKLEKLKNTLDAAQKEMNRQDAESQKEDLDLYGIILSHLLDEGYAETPEAAEAIMVNMSEEWRDSIIG